MRSESLQNFLDVARDAFFAHVDDPRSTESLRRIFTALDTPGAVTDVPGSRLPVCACLNEGAEGALADASLRPVTESFLRLEPDLRWRTSGDRTNASPGFAENHGNTYIVGPGGLERRNDVWLGASLLAPNTRYPDHTHPPEETYLVLSPGEFMHGSDPWFEPGIGGTFYNSPGVMHAMRSGAKPLLALWALWAGPRDARKGKHLS